MRPANLGLDGQVAVRLGGASGLASRVSSIEKIQKTQRRRERGEPQRLLEVNQTAIPQKNHPAVFSVNLCVLCDSAFNPNSKVEITN